MARVPQLASRACGTAVDDTVADLIKDTG